MSPLWIFKCMPFYVIHLSQSCQGAASQVSLSPELTDGLNRAHFCSLQSVVSIYIGTYTWLSSGRLNGTPDVRKLGNKVPLNALIQHFMSTLISTFFATGCVELWICQSADLWFTPAGELHHEARLLQRGVHRQSKAGL